MWNLKVFNLQLHKTKESIKFSHLRNWNQRTLACLIDGLHKIIWRFIDQSSRAFKARANFWYPPKAEFQGAKFVRWWDEVKFNGRCQEQMCCVKVEISQVRLKNNQPWSGLSSENYQIWAVLLWLTPICQPVFNLVLMSLQWAKILFNSLHKWLLLISVQEPLMARTGPGDKQFYMLWELTAAVTVIQINMFATGNVPRLQRKASTSEVGPI